jgi:hypothetical protein
MKKLKVLQKKAIQDLGYLKNANITDSFSLSKN